MLKRMSLSVRSCGFSLKNWRFLKRIFLFIATKVFYLSGYQHLSCNARNNRFSASKDNAPTNIACMNA